MKQVWILLVVLLIACGDVKKTIEREKSDAYTVIEEGIFVEKFDSTIVDDNRYNFDNLVFKVGRTFVYDYQYVDKAGQAFHFEGGRDGWNFAPVGTDRYYVVKQVHVKVLPGLEPMIQTIPDYNQTLLNFTCPPNTDYTISGVVENYRNIWMHPPREALFRILELNPFPFIQAPYEVGHTWEWELEVDPKWGDPRWATWEGIITNKYNYKIVESKTIPTAFGDLDCLLIKADATSELGATSMLAAFHPNYGFVDMKFVNIDGSKMSMTLSELKTEETE